MRFALTFGLLSLLIALKAAQLFEHASGAVWILFWALIAISMNLMALALVYGLHSTGIHVDQIQITCPWSYLGEIIFLPYSTLGKLTLYIASWIDHESPFDYLAPSLYIGRLPFPWELKSLQASGITAVLNLCWEFPQFSSNAQYADLLISRVKILDGYPPTSHQFNTAVRQVVAWRAQGDVILIHCAQGHGRTATIAAAALLELNLAPDVNTALAMITTARPLAKPSRQQKHALLRFALDRKHVDENQA